MLFFSVPLFTGKHGKSHHGTSSRELRGCGQCQVHVQPSYLLLHSHIYAHHSGSELQIFTSEKLQVKYVLGHQGSLEACFLNDGHIYGNVAGDSWARELDTLTTASQFFT